MFELQCLALRKDSEMYKDRIEAVLRQMEEVVSERDQVGRLPPRGQGTSPFTLSGEGTCQRARGQLGTPGR